jgi:hypothetical protein
MKSLPALLVCLLGCVISPGCKSNATATPVTIKPAREDTVQGDLDRLAAAFTELVLIVGREPEVNESLGEFFRRLPFERLEKLPASVHLNQKGVLVTSNGIQVTWTRKFESCLLLIDGSSDTSMRYFFRAKGHPESAEVSVALHYGAPASQK